MHIRLWKGIFDRLVVTHSRSLLIFPRWWILPLRYLHILSLCWNMLHAHSLIHISLSPITSQDSYLFNSYSSISRSSILKAWALYMVVLSTPGIVNTLCVFTCTTVAWDKKNNEMEILDWEKKDVDDQWHADMMSLRKELGTINPERTWMIRTGWGMCSQVEGRCWLEKETGKEWKVTGRIAALTYFLNSFPKISIWMSLNSNTPDGIGDLWFKKRNMTITKLEILKKNEREKSNRIFVHWKAKDHSFLWF